MHAGVGQDIIAIHHLLKKPNVYGGYDLGADRHWRLATLQAKAPAEHHQSTRAKLSQRH